jgi:hypothetical protein
MSAENAQTLDKSNYMHEEYALLQDLEVRNIYLSLIPDTHTVVRTIFLLYRTIKKTY